MPAELPPVDAAPPDKVRGHHHPFNALRNSGQASGGATSLRCSAWAASDTSASSTPRKWVFTRSASQAREGQGSPRPKTASAAVYIDNQAQDPAAELLKLGGSAKVILATATSGEAMSAVEGGLSVNGTLLIVGAVQSMQVSPLALLLGCRSVKGWNSGTSIDSQDTLTFSMRTGVRSMNETYPLERVSEAYERMMSGKARFRVVLTIP